MTQVLKSRIILNSLLLHKSIKSWKRVLNLYFVWLDKENLEVEEITYNDLLLFVKHHQRRSKSQSTIKGYVAVVKHFYDHLIREGR